MWKIIKRTLLVVVALIALGIGYLVAYDNSEKLAKTMVSLECELADTDLDAKFIEEHHDLVLFARLKRDWLKNRVLLNFIESEAGDSESGLKKTIVLRENVGSYSGYAYVKSDLYAHRSIDRNSLIYRREARRGSSKTSELFNWIERKCKIIPNQKFDKLRDNSAASTKEMQKI